MALTPEQKAIRLRGVTGSEVAAIAGLNPWSSPLDVYLSKKGLVEEQETFQMERGTFLEPAIIKWYEHRTGRTVRPTGTLIHPHFPIVIATPDGESIGQDRRALEVKSPDWRRGSLFGESGTDQVPRIYLPQVTWECAVLETHVADLVALVDGDIRIFHVPFNPRLFEALREMAERFWHDHIVADNPPPPDGSEKARLWLNQMYPRATADLIEADEQIVELALEYGEARDAEAEAKKVKAEARNKLCALIGTHEGATGDGVSVSWRNNKDGFDIDLKSLIAELNPPQALIEKHTHVVPGPRVLRVSIK